MKLNLNVSIITVVLLIVIGSSILYGLLSTPIGTKEYPSILCREHNGVKDYYIPSFFKQRGFLDTEINVECNDGKIFAEYYCHISSDKNEGICNSWDKWGYCIEKSKDSKTKYLKCIYNGAGVYQKYYI